VATLNGLIAEHNAQQQEFLERQSQAKEELRHDMILEHDEEHERLVRDLGTAKAQLERRRRLHEKLVQCAATLRTQVRDHGPAVARMNDLLTAYLGHQELRLETFDEGYQIVRHGEPLRGPLSEGERTAIALCYFLCKLKEQGRHLNEQIVVVDDPVSSLDAGALNYAFNLLRVLLQNAQQLIILTHNLSYMNEVKKWLKSGGYNKTSCLLFLRSWQIQNRRQSTIIEMPKLLRTYDSEYQYMFSLVRMCILANGNPDEIPVYIMPNVMRRVLELFLAFKAPGTESLTHKLNHSLVTASGLDATRLHALNRLTHVESHSDSMDDFIGFSTMTSEEIFGAADALMKLIETLDQHHYERLCKLSA
jgi:wobble nucleotide-excising tRNase